MLRDIGIVGVGTLLLIGGGHLMVEGAVDLAQRIGVSEAVIGLTVVAFGTSVPDLTASVMAAWHRHGDIAIGNVIGSVMFNLLNVLGITGLVRPLDATGIAQVDYWVMLGMLGLTIPLLRTGFRVRRLEGALCFILYLAYLIWRWPS
jgi:cation:H+ antiporter